MSDQAVVETATPSLWASLPLPSSAAEWIARAEQVAEILAEDALARDRANQAPHAEVQLLKDSGLVTLLGPAAFGGGGQEWVTALAVVRTVSRADASIGQLLGYHYLWAWAVRLVGTEPQIAAVEELYTTNTLFFGGAVNPRDGDLTISEEGEELVYNGRKSFSTGGRISDLTVLEGVLDGTETHIFVIVPTDQPGIQFAGDWDNLGQRLSESGSVVIDGVRADWASAAGFENKVYLPLTYNSLNVPLVQQIFSNIYLGIAQGAVAAAAEYTRTTTRAWPYGGDNKQEATEEFYILSGYGELQSKLWADEALIDQVDRELSAVLHAEREALTEKARGDVAVRIAAAKLRIAEDGLEAATKVFELTGARASSNKVGLDIYWRNLRTHSLHDPLPYKKREVGEYVLLGALPAPSWYT
ncbi:acyl-CoA dehydrogenase family protein [Subtercola frigoramans]|uniref:Alkylation response protein AidB-like acyl-CoA dehydrogenase n=1 Tax=Subtercola frigoramans TaxID=120298 RepID=A0ABS2L2K7_9MICO|nr:acyl-CoA dehydrogenase family protein [Subtercola frigoramans]MBM7471317.1 alkylation response protein AidB-like acyl-CoA dehydrogenase [Subtercola frigoramans]